MRNCRSQTEHCRAPILGAVSRSTAPRIGALQLFAFVSMLTGSLPGETVFLANFNQGIDADFSLVSPTGTPGEGVKITTGNKGYPFAGEKVSEALDLGYAEAQSEAGVEYELPLKDLRTGTIEVWVKLGFDWRTKAGELPKFDAYNFIDIPLTGGNYNRIGLTWYNQAIPYFNFYIYDGAKQVQIGLRPDSVGVRTPVEFTREDWHYVAVTWKPTQARMFIDGHLVSEQTSDEPLNIGEPVGTMLLGGGKTRYGKAFGRALIDGLRIGNQALFSGQNEISVPKEAPTRKDPSERGPAPKAGEPSPDASAETNKVLFAGGPGTVMYAKPRKTYRAPKLAAAPVIDGDLADPVWRTAPRATGFVAMKLETPFVDTQTTVQAGWDDDNLYLAMVCHENRMDNLTAKGAGKDCFFCVDDAIEVFLGPWTDKPKEYFQLAVNTGEGYYDGKGMDAKWDGVWRHAVKKAKDRWTLELAIPFKTLGVATPTPGSLWKWNVARDRQAGGGMDMLSSVAAVTAGWHAPDEFDKLLFVNPLADVAAEEAKFNAEYLAATAGELKKKLDEADKELLSSSHILARTKAQTTTGALKQDIEAWKARFQAVLAKESAEFEEYNQNRLAFRDFDKSLLQYAQEANKLGFVSAGNLPAKLNQGVTKSGDYWFLHSSELTAAIDPVTGILCGIYDRNRKAIVSWSYDLYFIETAKETRKSDERLDEVIEAKPDQKSVRVVCKNPQMPDTLVTKRYFFAPVGRAERMLCKEVSVKGQPREKTLLSFVSRTQFDPRFREPAYYHRVKPTGTAGDPRAVFWAKDIKEPALLHFLFRDGAAANLCAVNPQTGEGIGQYWFKANGKWVMPNGYEGNKSYFTDSGWDLSWFATFLGQEPRSAEMRYHLFAGDRTVFHREYRDLPERQAVINAVPVGSTARARRYEACLGPMEGATDVKNPKSQSGMAVAFLYGRLRSDEYVSGFSCGTYRDLRHGDYPTGDDALLHYEYGKDSKTYPAKKIKDGILEGKQLYPRVQTGWYHCPQYVSFLSQPAMEHPAWFLKGKDGQPPSGYEPGSGLADFSPEFVNELIARLVREMDYHGMEVLYLDYAITGPWVDWGKGIVRHSEVSYDFLIRLNREVRKRHGVFFLNSTTFDGVHDLGYWEGFSAFNAYEQTWRDVADGMMMRRIYDRPGARTIPLYWLGGDEFKERKNYRDYTNLVLSQLFGVAPCWHDPYPIHFKDPVTGQTDWKANYAHQVAYFDVAFEAGDTLWQDVDLQPAWWRDFATHVEAYAFRKGPACLFTILRHQEKAAADVVLSANMKKLGFAPDRPTFIWQFHPRDPDQFPRRGGPQPENWDKLFTTRTCAVVPPGTAKDRLTFNAPAVEPELTRLLAATQVPAVFCSLEGQETNLLLPEMLGGRIEGPLNASAKGYELKIQSPYPAEILVYPPASKTTLMVNGTPAKGIDVKFGDTVFLRVAAPKGQSTVRIESQ